MTTSNNNHIDENITIEHLDLSVIEAQDRAQIDVQIETAKKYPRKLSKVRDNVIAIASMDEDTARSCGYAVPRGGKNITGPSVHLARIVVQQYGNVRVEARISNIDHTHVTGQATCIDLENNVGIRVEVKRKIIDSKGKRYSDDIITVNGNAIAAIALRNAVYAVVPKPIIDAGYKAAQQKIIGDVSDETKLLAKRKTALEYFERDHGVSEADLLRTLGLREVTQIKGEHLVILAGMRQAITDGEFTAAEMFYPDKDSDEATAEQKKSTSEELKNRFTKKTEKDAGDSK